MVGERGEGGEGGEGGEAARAARAAAGRPPFLRTGAAGAVGRCTSYEPSKGRTGGGQWASHPERCRLDRRRIDLHDDVHVTPSAGSGPMLVTIFFSTLAALVVPITLAHGPTGARHGSFAPISSTCVGALDLTLDGCARVLTRVCRRGPAWARVLLLQVHGFVRDMPMSTRRRDATTLA